MQQDFSVFIEQNTAELYALIADLCRIPAPSHQEDARAAFCRDYLVAAGAKGVFIDDVKNVIFPLCAEGSNALTVFAAHTDTVFPDTEPMPFSDDGEYLRSPGVGDDTTSLAVLLMLAKYHIVNGIKPRDGILFVANSCEEGLGNLLGVRRLMETYRGRVKQFVTFDSKISILNDRCVGSHRYRVVVRTEGGHSYSAFGNKNAIAELAAIARAIYALNVPAKENTRTTYNVGTISGGTSVNTIAQYAEMLCEYRSDDEECLAVMEKEFGRIFSEAKKDDVAVEVERIAERPTAKGVNEQDLARLIDTAAKSILAVTGVAPRTSSASTDCNIPLSLGIPAVCVGVYEGDGLHTREEWVKKASVPVGLDIALRLCAALTAQ